MNIAIEKTEIENKYNTMNELYEELASATSLATVALEMDVFKSIHHDSVRDVYQLVKLIQRCLNTLEEKREEIEEFINNLSNRYRVPAPGDHLPGELVETLLKMVARPETNQSFGLALAAHGTALLRHIKNDPSVVNAAQVLVDIAVERGLNLQIIEHSSTDMELAYYSSINNKPE